MNQSNITNRVPWVITFIFLLFSVWLFWLIDKDENRLIEYENRVDSCLTVIKLQKVQMDAVSHLYNVDFNKLKSEKADSAFMLLELYRDKLHYDSINNHWYITEMITERNKYLEIHHQDTIKQMITYRDSVVSNSSTDSI